MMFSIIAAFLLFLPCPADDAPAGYVLTVSYSDGSFRCDLP